MCSSWAAIHLFGPGRLRACRRQLRIPSASQTHPADFPTSDIAAGIADGRRAMPIPSRSDFEAMYAGQAPWDIGRPQQAFVNVADQIRGSILDAGCGSGDNALFFAERGHKVT